MVSKSGGDSLEPSPEFLLRDAFARVVYRCREIELVFGGVEVDERDSGVASRTSLGAAVGAKSFLLRTDDGRKFLRRALFGRRSGVCGRALLAGVHEKGDAVTIAEKRVVDFAAKSEWPGV